MSYRADSLDVGDYLITSRSLAEYLAMFGLGEPRGRILDCPGGASSFAAEATTATAATADVVAVDPMYHLSATDLAERVRTDIARAAAWTTATVGRYNWTFYGGPEGHTRMRTESSERFTRDLLEHPERYVPGVLPALDFADDEFDLVLSSHLLFTYADRLDFAFHLAALSELARVGRQVRVFPLIDQAGGDRSALVDRLREALSGNGIRSEIRHVDFEFQLGADQMLVLDRAAF